MRFFRKDPGGVARQAVVNAVEFATNFPQTRALGRQRQPVQVEQPCS
jgi:hypothetical protein